MYCEGPESGVKQWIATVQVRHLVIDTRCSDELIWEIVESEVQRLSVSCAARDS